MPRKAGHKSQVRFADPRRDRLAENWWSRRWTPIGLHVQLLESPRLPGGFGQQKLDLGVDTAQVVGGPSLECGVEPSVQPEQKTFLFRHWYSVPVLMTGCASRSQTSATIRLLTMVARFSSSNSTTFC